MTKKRQGREHRRDRRIAVSQASGSPGARTVPPEFRVFEISAQEGFSSRPTQHPAKALKSIYCFLYPKAKSASKAAFAMRIGKLAWVSNLAA